MKCVKKRGWKWKWKLESNGIEMTNVKSNYQLKSIYREETLIVAKRNAAMKKVMKANLKAAKHETKKKKIEEKAENIRRRKAWK